MFSHSERLPFVLVSIGQVLQAVLRKKSVRGYSSREILLMSMGLPFLVRLWHPAALCESFLPYCP